MMDWILTNPEYTALYHRYIAEFLETVDPVEIIDGAYALIAAEVERDPTKFCTYQEFEDGVEALKTFCILRRESISGQLAGTIPSTRDGQSAEDAALVDASGLTLSDMGTMTSSRGGRLENGGGPDGGQTAAGMPPEAGGGRPEQPAGQENGGAAGMGSAALLCLLSGLVLLAGLLAAFKWRH